MVVVVLAAVVVVLTFVVVEVVFAANSKADAAVFSAVCVTVDSGVLCTVSRLSPSVG